MKISAISSHHIEYFDQITKLILLKIRLSEIVISFFMGHVPLIKNSESCWYKPQIF